MLTPCFHCEFQGECGVNSFECVKEEVLGESRFSLLDDEFIVNVKQRTRTLENNKPFLLATVHMNGHDIHQDFEDPLPSCPAEEICTLPLVVKLIEKRFGNVVDYNSDEVLEYSDLMERKLAEALSGIGVKWHSHDPPMSGINYGLIKANEETLVYVEELSYEHTSYRTKIYRLFRAKLGQTSYPMFLVTKPEENFSVALQKHYIPIRPCDSAKIDKLTMPNDYNLIRKTARNLAIITKNKDPATLWKSIQAHHELALKNPTNIMPVFWEVTDYIDETTLDQVKKLDFDQLMHDFLYENYEKDDDIVYVVRGQIVPFTDSPQEYKNKWQDLQKYGSHTVLVTNTKTGKTSGMKKVANVYDWATPARLTGFSTADSSYIGDLEGAWLPFAIDDAQKLSTNELIGLNNYEEMGETVVGKGKQTLLTRGTAPIIYIANPSGDTPNELMASFDILLQKLGTLENARAMGSRKALTMFGVNFRPTTLKIPERLSKEDLKKNNAMVHTVRKSVIPKVEKLVLQNKNITRWLNEADQQILNYQQAIESLIQQHKSQLLPRVREYWLGTKDAYRHMKGLVFRQACADYLKELWLTGNPDSFESDLLNSAEDHLIRIIQMNLESLKNMVTLSPISMSDYVYNQWNNLHDYEKMLVLAVAGYVKLIPQTVTAIGTTLDIGNLKTVYDGNLTVQTHKLVPSYEYFTQVLSRIEKKEQQRIDHMNRNLASTFGIRVEVQNNKVQYIVVDNKNIENLPYLAQRLGL